MRIKQRFGPAGSWVFELSDERVGQDRAALDGLIYVLARVALELERRHLLAPRVVLLRRWLTRRADARPREPDTAIVVADAIDIVPASRKVLDELDARRGFREPAAVQVHGTGIALDGAGQPHEEGNLLWLKGYDLDVRYIEVSTQSDVWMSHDFRAGPQPEIAKRNGPHLEQALRAIEAMLQVSCEASEHTRFAVPIQYGLANHTGGTDAVNAIDEPEKYLEAE
jgi:hypothetical protein